MFDLVAWVPLLGLVGQLSCVIMLRCQVAIFNITQTASIIAVTQVWQQSIPECMHVVVG